MNVRQHSRYDRGRSIMPSTALRMCSEVPVLRCRQERTAAIAVKDLGMSDTGPATATGHRDRILDLAEQAFDTSTATMLMNYQATAGLISMVAAPGNHIDQAIELLTERRDEAETIARRELEQLSQDEQEQFKLAVARHVWKSMIVAADMLARSGNLMRVPDIYALPPDVVAAVGAVLTTSGLLKDAIAILDAPRP